MTIFFLHAFTAKIKELHDLTAKKQLPILLKMHACRQCVHLWATSDFFSALGVGDPRECRGDVALPPSSGPSEGRVSHFWFCPPLQGGPEVFFVKGRSGTHNPRFVVWPLELGLGTHNPRFVAWPLELGLGTHNPRFVAWPLELGLGTHNPRLAFPPLFSPREGRDKVATSDFVPLCLGTPDNAGVT